MSITTERFNNLSKDTQVYVLELENYCNYWHIHFNVLQEIDFFENLKNDGIPF